MSLRLGRDRLEPNHYPIKKGDCFRHINGRLIKVVYVLLPMWPKTGRKEPTAYCTEYSAGQEFLGNSEFKWKVLLSLPKVEDSVSYFGSVHDPYV